jgi:glyceraldehyde-3-phosphate dehydrogenase/erythrose-4-phosphate dehydrogenase
MGYNKNYLTMLKRFEIQRWYDNEWAYSLRVVDLCEYIVKKGL